MWKSYKEHKRPIIEKTTIRNHKKNGFRKKKYVKKAIEKSTVKERWKESKKEIEVKKNKKSLF